MSPSLTAVPITVRIKPYTRAFIVGVAGSNVGYQDLTASRVSFATGVVPKAGIRKRSRTCL